MKKKTVFIDYDGVIIDSINEKLFTGFNAYFDLNKNTKLFNSKRLNFDNYSLIVKENVHLVNIFKSLVPFIGLAGENACAFKIIEYSESLPSSKQEFQHAVNMLCVKSYNRYDYLVKSLRNNYSKHNLKDFLSLCPPHKIIIKIINKYRNRINWKIITNKKIKNVLFLNKQFKIEKSIHKIHYCNPNTNKKSKIIQSLMKSKLLKKKQIIFIDDLYSNLMPLYKKGYNCFLANWGFELDEVKLEVSKLGLNIIDKSNFEVIINANE